MRISSIVPLALLAISLLAIPVVAGAQMTGEDIEDLQTKIDAQGHKWTAGQTALSSLSLEEFQAMLIPMDEYNAMVEETKAMRSHSGAPLPPPPAPEDAIFNWRDVDGEDWTSPVQNQGLCGSCTIFAGVGAIEGSINVAMNDPDGDWDLSEQNLLSCTGVTCESGGMSPAAAFTWAKNRGVPDEACQVYQAVNGECNDGCEDVDERSLMIVDWDFVANGSPWDTPTDAQIKNALSTYGPIGTSMTVYADLQSYISGVYEVGDGQAQLGGHSIAIVGWNDANDSWYVKNSWGASWGDFGFFEIKRGESGLGESTTSWVFVDPETVPGSFVLSGDEIEASIEVDSGDSVDETISIQRSAGAGDLPFTVVIPDDAPWLSVDPANGANVEDDVELTFTFDITKWNSGDPIDQEVVITVLGTPGLAQTMTAKFHATNFGNPGDDTDTGNAEDIGSESDSGSCSLSSVGAGSRVGLLSSLLAIFVW